VLALALLLVGGAAAAAALVAVASTPVVATAAGPDLLRVAAALEPKLAHVDGVEDAPAVSSAVEPSPSAASSLPLLTSTSGFCSGIPGLSTAVLKVVPLPSRWFYFCHFCSWASILAGLGDVGSVTSCDS
ncbi:unnamed protein product, partial [Ectocarpus sp. 12 AP-2014]